MQKLCECSKSLNKIIFYVHVMTFQNFFRLCFQTEVSKKLTIGHQKASYIISDGLGLFVVKELCKRISASGGAFTLLFDETATFKNRKQMDILIRFWDENEKLVSTIYMLSLFCNCLATLNVAEMFLDIHNDDYKKKYSIKWEL